MGLTSAQYLSNIENGRCLLAMDRCFQVEKLLGVEIFNVLKKDHIKKLEQRYEAGKR